MSSSSYHIHFRALFSSTEGWAFSQVFLEGVLSTQNDFEGQQNPYLASFCHSQALHPMISLACQIFSVQPHSACILLQSSLCCALHVQTISSYWCGAPHLSPGCLRVRAQGSLNATAFLMHPALAATTEDCIRATNSWLTDTTGVLSRFLQHVQINARLHNLCLSHIHI